MSISQTHGPTCLLLLVVGVFVAAAALSRLAWGTPSPEEEKSRLLPPPLPPLPKSMLAPLANPLAIALPALAAAEAIEEE